MAARPSDEQAAAYKTKILQCLLNLLRMRCRVRRGGKSRAIGALCVFVAVFVDHSSVLVPGERPVVLCLAPTAKQAGVVYGYICAIFESSPLLAKLVTNKTAEILSLTNGIEIEVRPASFRGVRGLTCVAVVG